MTGPVDIDEAIGAAEQSAETAAHQRDKSRPFPSRNYHKRKFAEAMDQLARLRAAKARGETTAPEETA